MKINQFRGMIRKKYHSGSDIMSVRSLFFYLLFSLFLIVPVSASTLQDTKISIQRKDVSLSQVFNEIESKTGYSFLVRNNDVDINEKVSVNAENKSIEEILSMLFTGKDIKYEVAGKRISVYKPVSTNTKQVGKRKITGNVTDITYEPIIGASIVVVGATTGTVTDLDGNFSLEVDDNAKIQISYLGYTTQTIATTNKSNFVVVLEESSKLLEEVVVVGYGTMRKKDLTGSVTQIRPGKIQNENPKTVQDVLRGTPGLNVGYDPSAKGGGTMELRGQRSVYTEGGHNNPLLILDGMVFYGELSEISPDNIAQIDILKDASAAAVYGAKAASGVIIITTKKGNKGKPIINVSTNFGLTQLYEYRDRFAPEAYMQHRQDWYTKNTYGVNPVTGAYDAYQTRDANTGKLTVPTGYYMRPDQLSSDLSLDIWRAYTTNQPGESDQSIWAKRLGFQGNALDNFLNRKTVDWADKTFRTGFNQDYNASISGAGESVNYYFSMGYLKNEGTLKSDTYQAARASMKVDVNVTKWLQVGANVNFQDRSDGEIGIEYDYQMRNSPYADYADANGNPVQYPLSGEYSQRGYNYDFQKQYLELEKGYTTLNTILNAKITLPYNITYSFNASPRYQFFYDRYFMSAELPGSDPKTRGANREQTKRFDWSLNNTITWDYTFNKKHHTILTLVQEAEELQSWQDRIEARNILPSDALGFHNTKNGSKESSTYSSSDSHQTADALLARLFYSYDNRYMLTTSIRRDGYSAFGQSNPYATFPSAAVAWTFVNEDFFKWNDVMSHGKLRASYGENGNRSLDNPYMALSNLYEGAGKMQGYINSAGELLLLRYLMAQRMANPNLQWEKTKSLNFGLDFGFLKDRISGSIEYYSMSTNDMIMNQRLPNFTGFDNITTNLGQVDNRGVELSLNTLNVNNQNFKWTTTLGLSYNKNEIKHLYYQYEDVKDANGNVIGTKEMDDITNGWFIGKPISTIWTYRVTGIWQKDEIAEAAKYGQRPGDPKVANNYTADDKVNPDGSVTPVYNDKDKEFLGQRAAPVQWSMRNEFELWKNLSFSFNMYSYMGHKSTETMYMNFDDDGGRTTYALQDLPSKEYWTVDNPTNKYARIEAKGPTGATSPGMLYDRSFIRLDNVSLAYSIPQSLTKKWNIDRVKVYGTVRNVATWTKDWEYGDPEGAGDGRYSTRVWTLGLNLTF